MDHLYKGRTGPMSVSLARVAVAGAAVATTMLFGCAAPAPGGPSFQEQITGVAPNTMPKPKPIFATKATPAQIKYVEDYCAKEVPNMALRNVTGAMQGQFAFGRAPTAQELINSCHAEFLPPSAVH